MAPSMSQSSSASSVSLSVSPESMRTRTWAPVLSLSRFTKCGIQVSAFSAGQRCHRVAAVHHVAGFGQRRVDEVPVKIMIGRATLMTVDFDRHRASVAWGSRRSSARSGARPPVAAGLRARQALLSLYLRQVIRRDNVA